MKDPYHSARQRFKVARDRWAEYANNECLSKFRTAQEAIDLINDTPLEKLANLPPSDDLCGEMIEAAGILHTMQKWKTTDERQALMLWKLSRD